MSDIDRRTVEDLITRYELEPEIRDVFVEGKFDCEIYRAALSHNDEDSCVLYEIDGVDISAAMLIRHGLTEGRQQRVRLLSREFDKGLKNEAAVRCVSDRDLEGWVGDLENNRFLIWSTYTSIELHFLDLNIIRALIVNLCGASLDDSTGFYDNMVESLKYLFAGRLVDRRLRLGLRWSSFDKQLSISGSTINLDHHKYFTNVLNLSGFAAQSDRFFNVLDSTMSELSGDARHYIRGHDLVAWVSWASKRMGGNQAPSALVERGMILLASQNTEISSALRLEIQT